MRGSPKSIPITVSNPKNLDDWRKREAELQKNIILRQIKAGLTPDMWGGALDEVIKHLEREDRERNK